MAEDYPCDGCEWYQPFPWYVHVTADGFCRHPRVASDLSMPLYLCEGRARACRYRRDREPRPDFPANGAEGVS